MAILENSALDGIVEESGTLARDWQAAAWTDEEFLARRFDAGLAWVWFPPEAGGLGADRNLQGIVDAQLEAAGAPQPDRVRNPIGHGMAAPTIGIHGTPAQQARWLRPLYIGADIWCQLFSEPGAGSDLGALSTRAVRDGDTWVVNGQKVWTTLAHTARWGILLARTDPSAVKHRGLTYFVVDMASPGVEVRPLRQMTGDAEFNEVFLNDVMVPDDCRIGEVGEGWRVAMTTLMNERVAIGGGTPPRGSGPIGRAMELSKSIGLDHPVQRDRLLQLWVRAEVNRLTNLRANELQRTGTPGPEGSVGKLAMAELNQAIYEFCVDVLGPEGALYPEPYTFRRPDNAEWLEGDVRHLFLRTRANTIEGGTSEIMRNILGERVLGLPGEPRVDKDVPWNQVPR